jgi:hypothetical protein
MRARRWLGAVAVAIVLLAGADAAADWPMARHDARRTAVTTGKGNLTSPVPAWKYYTGGSVGFYGAITGDVDGDGLPEIFFVRGSGVVGKKLDDTTLWASPPVDAVAILGLADLDGDGKPELIVKVGLYQVAVFDALTGALDWLEPSTEVGAVGDVLIQDLNGDGVPDLLIEDCGAGTLPGAVYSFAGDVTAPELLWALPPEACTGGNYPMILDAVGDGMPQVLIATMDGFELLAGATGQVLASVDHASSISGCVPAQITGGPGEQAVCILNRASTSDSSGHRVLAVGYTATPAPALTVLWDQTVGMVDAGVAYEPGLVADLDGDGKLEVTVTAQDDALTWSTHVLDAVTGTELGAIAGHKLAAVAPIQAGGRSLILTTESGGTDAWSFNRTESPTISKSPTFELMGQGLTYTPDFVLTTLIAGDKALVAADFTGDGVADLVVTGTDGTLQIIDASTGMPTPVATATAPPGAGLLWAGAVELTGNPGLVTGWSDGFFRAYDAALTVANPPGAAMAGYWATSFLSGLDLAPVVGALGGVGPDAVLFTDSTGTLRALDASHADMSTAPVERWSLPGTTAPVILPASAGPAVYAIQRQPGATGGALDQIVALGPDGSSIWTAPIAGQTLADLVTGNIDGDGIPDIVVQWGAAADDEGALHNRAIAGVSGATLWDGKVFGPPNGEPAGGSVADWNGDGIDDFFLQYSGTHVLSGKDGTEIGTGTTEMAPNCTPIVFDVAGDGTDEIILQAGETVVRELSHDLQHQLYASTDTQDTILYGAIAQCPGGDTRLVEGTYITHTARLTITDFAPASQGETTMILAGGKKFPDEATAQASGALLGVLTAVSVHSDLSGQGHPSAVMGSTDGWLYSVNPCTGDLEYAVDFKNAVGSVAFGDTDGDGLDEILVEVSDGYLYDLKQPPITGTGGSGGAGGTGGSTGSGGAGSGLSLDTVTGRATCACSAPGSPAPGTLGLKIGWAAVSLALARRRQRAGPGSSAALRRR